MHRAVWLLRLHAKRSIPGTQVLCHHVPFFCANGNIGPSLRNTLWATHLCASKIQPFGYVSYTHLDVYKRQLDDFWLHDLHQDRNLLYGLTLNGYIFHASQADGTVDLSDPAFTALRCV